MCVGGDGRTFHAQDRVTPADQAFGERMENLVVGPIAIAIQS